MATKNEKIQYVDAHNFLAAWDLVNDRPLFNPGRDDAESWGSPERAIPPEMLGGYDVSKGAMIALEPAEFCRLFGIPLESFDEWCLEQKNARIAKFENMPADSKGEPAKVSFHVPNRDVDISKPMDYSEGIQPSKDKPVDITYVEMAEFLKQGLTRKVKYIVVAGQRRSYAAPAISLLHQIANATTDAEGNSVIPEPFVFGLVVRTAPTRADLHRMLLRENEQNSKQVYSEVGKAVNAIQFVKEYPLISENELGGLLSLNDIVDKNGKVVPGGNRRQHRQRFARLATLANHPNFVKCNILERIRIEPTVENGYLREEVDGNKITRTLVYTPNGYIPVSKLDKEDMANLLGHTKPTTKVRPIVKQIYDETYKANPPKDSTGKELHPSEWNYHHIASPAEFERYVELLMSDKPKPKGAIDKPSMEKMLASVNVSCAYAQVGKVIKALLEGDEAFFSNLRAVTNDEQLSALVDEITTMDVFNLKTASKES